VHFSNVADKTTDVWYVQVKITAVVHGALGISNITQAPPASHSSLHG
jgi:hypothetical protein